MDFDVIGIGTDIQNRRRIYSEFKALMLVIEFDQSFLRLLASRLYILVLVIDNPQQDRCQVRIDHRHESKLETI